MLERSLARTVTAPSGIGFHTRIARDVEDAGVLLEHRAKRLDQRQRRKHIGRVDLLERIERVVQKIWLRAGPQVAGVVNHHIQAAQLAGGCRQFLAVAFARDAPWDGDEVQHSRAAVDPVRQGRSRFFQSLAVARIDHQPPFFFGKCAGQSQAQAARGAGNQCIFHTLHLYGVMECGIRYCSQDEKAQVPIGDI